MKEISEIIDKTIDELILEKSNLKTFKSRVKRAKADLKAGANLKRKSYRWSHRSGKKLSSGKGLSRAKVKKMARNLKRIGKRTKAKKRATAKINKNRFTGQKRILALTRDKIRKRGGVVRV